jgi:protein-tyrosine-phosphatase
MDIPRNSSSEHRQRWLFVCAGGIDRSPIAAGAARAMAAERGRKIEAEHLGLFDFLSTNFLEAA